MNVLDLILFNLQGSLLWFGIYSSTEVLLLLNKLIKKFDDLDLEIDKREKQIKIMLFSLFFGLIFNIGLTLSFFLKFDKIYLYLIVFPWALTYTISIFSMMTELHKYFVLFDLFTFLGFSKLFRLCFVNFTRFISFFIRIFCIIYLCLFII